MLRRVIELLPVLFLASIVVFLLLHLAPGDPSYFVAGRDATPEVREAVRQRMGLDKPLPVQYLIWLGDILRGNLGASALSGQPVSKLIWARLPATLHLTVAGFIVTILLALLAGIPGALRPNSRVDHFCSAYSAAAFGIPVFWLGILFILLFSVRLRWLPPSGYVSILEDPVRSLRFLLMPALTLGIANSGVLSRFIKFSVLETLQQDYIRTARSKGLAESVVIRRHAHQECADSGGHGRGSHGGSATRWRRRDRGRLRLAWAGPVAPGGHQQPRLPRCTGDTALRRPHLCDR